MPGLNSQVRALRRPGFVEATASVARAGGPLSVHVSQLG
jgi:hypothetical protein